MYDRQLGDPSMLRSSRPAPRRARLAFVRCKRGPGGGPWRHRGGQRNDGIARRTIGRGLRDLDSAASSWPSGRIRRSGGGRKAAVVEQPGLPEALTELIASAIRGDPQAALLWVSRGQRHLAEQLAVRAYRPRVYDETITGPGVRNWEWSSK